MRQAFLGMLLAASMTPALAQEKNFDLKISHWVPASHPLQKSLEDWAAAVEKDSGGTIESEHTVPDYHFRTLAELADAVDAGR